MLIESDLVFDESLLDNMCYPNRIAVAHMQAWMKGTTVTVDQTQFVKKFQKGTTQVYDDIRYKTVNIYSFSLSSWYAIVERLDQYISVGRVNNYYETVFAEMVADGSLYFKAVSFDYKPWYEIDTIADLAEAEKLFPAEIYQIGIPGNIILQASEMSTQFPQNNNSKDSKELVA
jgi:NDP-sugar pyrophosphorylase family protein